MSVTLGSIVELIKPAHTKMGVVPQFSEPASMKKVAGLVATSASGYHAVV